MLPTGPKNSLHLTVVTQGLAANAGVSQASAVMADMSTF